MCTSRPSAPAVQALPATPTEQDPAVQSAVNAERRRQAAALGRQSTILSGPAGAMAPATTATKTLLGA